MLRTTLIAVLLAASFGAAQAATSWTEGKITYYKRGNEIYANDGQRVGDIKTMLIPSDRRNHKPCLAFADRVVCD